MAGEAHVLNLVVGTDLELNLQLVATQGIEVVELVIGVLDLGRILPPTDASICRRPSVFDADGLGAC